MGRDEMRASDADRQQVADRLRHALDEGRLDLYEYDERLQRNYAAKTYGELNRLLADLPVHPPEAPVPALVAAPALAAAVSRGPAAAWLRHTWEPYLRMVSLTVGIWLLYSLLARELVYPWPIWVGGPWGVVLLVVSVSGLVGGEPARWAAEEERRAREKAAKKARRRQQKAERVATAAHLLAAGPARHPPEDVADPRAGRPERDRPETP